jgi:antitoxin ParD1/3/4
MVIEAESGDAVMVLNVALSEPMQAFIEEQIVTGKYGNASEYIYYLVEQEQERLAREQVEAMLLEGLESGEAIEVTDEWWQQKRDRLIQSHYGETVI